MRFEPNINVIIEKNGQTYKTPIVEIKNLNSFKALYGAVAYEYQRQVDDWLDTGRVMGERAKSTRGWDDVRGVTTHQRHKEDADEYRYFPDPDLVDLKVDDAWLKRIDDSIPQLPLAKQRKYVQEYGLSPVNARTLVDEPQVTAFFESVIAAGVEPKRAAALLLNYGAKYANERSCRLDELGITPQQIKEIADLAAADKIGSSAADELFRLCCDAENQGQSAQSLAEKRGLLQVSDTAALEGYVDTVLADARNARIVDDIKQGKDKAVGALLGQIMKLSKGQANPKLVTDLIKQKVRG
jgi:aspartyl-tRNA(Asn)/glutamyl-tRNA(Gln) amidotransferase subunit B